VNRIPRAVWTTDPIPPGDDGAPTGAGGGAVVILSTKNPACPDKGTLRICGYSSARGIPPAELGAAREDGISTQAMVEEAASINASSAHNTLLGLFCPSPCVMQTSRVGTEECTYDAAMEAARCCQNYTWTCDLAPDERKQSMRPPTVYFGGVVVSDVSHSRWRGRPAVAGARDDQKGTEWVAPWQHRIADAAQ
jgi:hypothetical protein